MEAVRASAKVALKKQFCNAPFFKTEVELDDYIGRIDKGIFAEHKRPEDYRDQLMAIVANAASIRDYLHEFDAEQLGKCDPSMIVTRTERIRKKREKMKRARETESFDQTSIYCAECRKVRRDRVNHNRMGLDSEELGTQFETNFENFCECNDSKWETEAEADAEKGSDSDFDSNSKKEESDKDDSDVSSD